MNLRISFIYSQICYAIRNIDQLKWILLKVVNPEPEIVPFSLLEWYVPVPVYILVPFRIYRILLYVLYNILHKSKYRNKANGNI